jgi:quinol monooxygenase YgiN
MVVLAVTWMAKVGHEAEVAALFQKLTEDSRKEPGCAMYQVHRHKTEARRFFIYEQYKDDAALEAHRSARWGDATRRGSPRPCFGLKPRRTSEIHLLSAGSRSDIPLMICHALSPRSHVCIARIVSDVSEPFGPVHSVVIW